MNKYLPLLMWFRNVFILLVLAGVFIYICNGDLNVFIRNCIHMSIGGCFGYYLCLKCVKENNEKENKDSEK